MNFKRIELIFLIAFLGLNIFLFQLYNEGANEKENVTNDNETASIESRLTADGISLKWTLSDEKKEGYYLSGEETSYASLINEYQNNNGIYNSHSVERVQDNKLVSYVNVEFDKAHVKKNVTDFLTNQGVPFGNEYTYSKGFSKLIDSEKQLLAVQAWEGIEFNDETAQIVIDLQETDKKTYITKYTQAHIEKIEPLREKQDLYSEKDAITTLYNNSRIPNDSTINWARLGYYRAFKVRGKNVYVPVWFVAIETKKNSTSQIEQVNAISNTVISGSSIAEVKN